MEEREYLLKKDNKTFEQSITITELIEELQILQEEGYGDFPVMFSDELGIIHLIPVCEEVELFKVKKMCTNDNTLFANTVHVWEEETLVLKGKLNRNYDQMTYSKKIKGEKMETIQDKIIQLMEEKCLNFQKELQYEKELEKELQTTGRIIEVTIDGDAFDSRYWNMRIYVSCGNATGVVLKLKELFPTAKFDDDLDIDDDICLVTAHIEGNVKQEPNVDK